MLIRSKLKTALAALVVTGAASTGAVHAQDSNAPGTRAEPVVVERAANGRPTSVRIEGVVYPVCLTENQDSCIQPREIGLGFGDRPLQHWPGVPVSERRAPARPAASTGR